MRFTLSSISPILIPPVVDPPPPAPPPPPCTDPPAPTLRFNYIMTQRNNSDYQC